MLRRVFLGLGLLVLTGIGPAIAAEQYPARPVRLIVGFAAGGPTDVLARVMAQWMTEKLGQQFIVDNRPGAGGNVATEAVLNSRPDGYTILVVVTANAINPTLYPTLPFDFFRDAQPVAGLGRISYVVAVTPSLPPKNVAEFLAYAKANPGKMNFASGGIGSSSHLSVEILKGITGTDMVHVPFRGNTAAYPDVISGRVQMIFADYASVKSHLASGSLRPLAVTSLKRWDALPGVPTVAETVPGYEAIAWYGFAAPAGTPPEIVNLLNRTINAGHADPGIKAKFANFDSESLVMSPSEFGDFMKKEAVRWGQAVKASGAKPQ